jgi:3-hydroxybutyryl-CoA dehydrogenase
MLQDPIKVAILSTQRQGLFPQNCQEPVELSWFDQFDPFVEKRADLYIDLDFNGSPERAARLKKLQPAIVAVNAVSHTCAELPEGFIRINGWPGFTHPEIMEMAWGFAELPAVFQRFLDACGKKCLRVPDTVGMVRPRVLAMIINEAWLAIEEKVSTPAEIDIAMKLGTNYPLGPMEWTSLIGRKPILDLLNKLSEQDTAYTPAKLLMQADAE